ncbi:hypothetical protein BAY60_01530 [Prauserella muralis]|uniref:Copper(I)-binding protein n=2 Tax=Prauserella muralis TaxID=588067 RepID=A0A2V4B7M8_9PSEU|nr:hypothetical protein BAY60_01530 [Prauserella muralis]
MLGAAVLGLGAALFLTGCGAGQITQTDTQAAAINGANAQSGNIAIRDAELAYPEGTQPAAYVQGANAEVMLSIVNQGGTNDQLVSVSSPAASGVSVTGDRAVPADSTLVVGPAAPGLDNRLHAEIVLEGLKRQVRPGQTVDATFTFRDAGPVEVELPISAPDEPRESEEGHEAEGGH